MDRHRMRQFQRYLDDLSELHFAVGEVPFDAWLEWDRLEAGSRPGLMDFCQQSGICGQVGPEGGR